MVEVISFLNEHLLLGKIAYLWAGGSDLAEHGKWVWAKSNRLIKVIFIKE